MSNRSNHAPLGRGEFSNARALTLEMEKALAVMEERSETWFPVLELALYASLEISKMQQALADLAALGMVETDDRECWRFVRILSEAEATRFAELEGAISRGLKSSFYDVGIALREIRDRRFYKTEFASFETYCQQQWDMKRRVADLKIKAAQVMDELKAIPIRAQALGCEAENEIHGSQNASIQKTENEIHGSQNASGEMVLPANERQIRPLTSLSPGLRRKAWDLAVRTAPNGKITAKHVKEVVKQMTQSSPKPHADNLPRFQPKVGDRVQIQFCDPREQELGLRRHHGQLGIVQEVNEFAVVVRTWGGVVSNLFLEEIRPASPDSQVTAPTEVLCQMIEAGYESAWDAIAQSWDRAQE